MQKQQLLESLLASQAYIEISRGSTRPIKLDEILQRRMEDFMDRRLKQIYSGNRKVEILE